MKHTSYFLICCFSVLFIFGCNTKTKESTSNTIDFSEYDDALRFFVIGDWGRKGESGQQVLADQMGKIADVVEPDFIVSAGDNFYPDGVASVEDYQWIVSYEQVYKSFSLNCPWYVVLGNHDYRGNVEAQIAYSERSRRWNLPQRFFHKDFESDGVKTRILFLDTSPFEDKYYSEEKYKDKVAQQDTVAQLIWIDSMLNTDQFDWKLVVGHHPMYTGGKRADEINTVRQHLENLLLRHNVQLYFAGHEHDIQHIKPKGQMHHIISGAGSDIRETGMLDISLFARSVQSFADVSITKDSLHFQFIDYKGDIIYRQALGK